MVEFNFYLTEDTFNKLADLKEQETDPEFRSMTFNEYARAILETEIWTRHRHLLPDEADLPF